MTQLASDHIAAMAAVIERFSSLSATRETASRAPTLKTVEEDPVAAARAARPFDRRRGGLPTRALMDDDAWAKENLRARAEEPIPDLANVMRIFERHPDFIGRFWFNKGMGKVVDRGSVLLNWQLDEIGAVIQERFLPNVDIDVVRRGLYIAANKNALKAGLAP